MNPKIADSQCEVVPPVRTENESEEGEGRGAGFHGRGNVSFLEEQGLPFVFFVVLLYYSILLNCWVFFIFRLTLAKLVTITTTCNM